MVFDNIIVKANHVARRVLGDTVFHKVFGYRYVPEYVTLRKEFNTIKNSTKKTIKEESKWLLLSSNGLLRVELAFLEEQFLEYLNHIEAFQKRVDDAADFKMITSNNVPGWINLLRVPANKLKELICDHLASIESRIDTLEAYDRAAEDMYSLNFTEISSTSSVSNLSLITERFDEDSSLNTVLSESSLSIASATSCGIFEPLLTKVDVISYPVFDLQVINSAPTAQCC